MFVLVCSHSVSPTCAFWREFRGAFSPGVRAVPVDSIAVGHHLGARLLAQHTHPQQHAPQQHHFHLQHHYSRDLRFIPSSKSQKRECCFAISFVFYLSHLSVIFTSVASRSSAYSRIRINKDKHRVEKCENVQKLVCLKKQALSTE